MERGKGSQGRGGKGKTPQYPADLFALGAKSGRVETAEGKRTGIVHGKASTSHSLAATDRKRDAAGSILSSLPPSKKAKVVGATSLLPARTGATAVASTAVGVSSASGTGPGAGGEAWEKLAIDCDTSDLPAAVLDANNIGDTERCTGLLCGALRTLRNSRWKPDSLLCTALLYLGSVKHSVFSSEPVTSALCSVMRRDSSPHSFKSKGPSTAYVTAAALLQRVFDDKKEWPESFVKLWVDDSLGDRMWVDQEDIQFFVSNVTTSVGTRPLPPRPSDPLVAAGLLRSESCPSPSVVTPTGPGDDDEQSVTGANDGTVCSINTELLGNMEYTICNRYASSQEAVEQIVMEAVREQLNRRQPPDNITRNFLRFLTACAGLVEVRVTAAPRLEMWLQNPKLLQAAKDLLMAICINCTTHTQRDVEVISHLVKIRIKPKALSNLYLASIRELINAHPENLATVLKHTIYNELSTARNPNNMAMLSVMFQAAPEKAAVLLADIFQDLLMNKDDYLRPLRALLREMVRVIRHEINLSALCRGLMADRKENTQAFREFEHKERMFVSVADLITLCIFLAISPAVKEAASLLARGDKREIQVLHNFQSLVAKIQRDAVWWLHDTAIKMYHPTPQDFVHVLHKVLFMEHQEHYYNKDMWPPENERSLMFRLASEVPVLDNTLINIFLIGLSKEHHLSPPDTLELADQLIKRAAALPSEMMSMLEANKLEIIDLLFNLTAYHHPDNINLPSGYQPPQLAITLSYWKAWVMLLILSAHNPSRFGSIGWEKYPTLRAFMEMCITNHFQYPPPTMSSGELLDETKTKELQIAAVEKQQILEFESYLAAASTKQTITEQTSLLLPQLITMDPTGPPRKPPQATLDSLRMLNSTHRMGHLLCRSRQPDFLLDIIQRQGASQSMPWLADLVESSEGALSHLPVQCLCEFLLSSGTLQQPEKQQKQQQLLQHLQALLTEPEQEPQVACEVLEYFLRRLSAVQAASRVQAVKGLKLILSSVTVDEDIMEVDNQTDMNPENWWLSRQLPQLPHFQAVRGQVIQALRQACQVESEPALVSSYICFLAAHAANDPLPEMAELVVDMAQLIVERSSIMAAILPSPNCELAGAEHTQHALMLMFFQYLQKAREPRREAYQWSESQDQILITWSTGEESTMHILVVHAIIILLNYGPGLDRGIFECMLEIWFPVEGEPPKAYLVDTSEEALLIPDWLKLRMIRSDVDRLVDAALTDLEPSQLVLFIQSFGIPVKSMSKLLNKLDLAVAVDPAQVAEAVLDKSYMAQLVEVQHRRGAHGGHILVQVLHLEQPSFPAESPVASSAPARLPLELGSELHAMRSSSNVPVTAVPETLIQIFKVKQETDAAAVAAKENLFRTFQKTLTMEMQSGNTVVMQASIKFLHDVMLSPMGNDWVTVMVKVPQYANPLLRLVTAAANKLSATCVKQLTVICQKISDGLYTDKCPLATITKQFLHKHTMPEKKAMPLKKLELSKSPMEVLQQTPIAQLERVGRQLLDERLQQRHTGELVEAMSQLVVSDTRPHCRGMLVDWLAAVEPEVIGSCPQLQMQLLFSKTECGNSGVTQTCRPYLLTLLAHRASWSTLFHCVQRLLNKFEMRYHPTAVLDFMWALTCNPKLWQGREKFTPKHYSQEDVLNLTREQLLVLVEYIVEEAVMTSGIGEYQDKMELRLPLMLQCLSQHEDRALVAQHLITVAAAKNGVRSEVAQKLLLQLYLRIPSVIHYFKDDEREPFLENASVSDWTSSTLDSMSHTVLTALTASHQGKDWARRSQEYELSARKMASVHPVLVLRQLPMLAAALCGRVHLEFPVFRSRNHLNLFTQVLGLLELLQPHLFKPEHARGLEDILMSYFALFKYHGHMKDLVALLNRFVALLQNFISHDAHRALKYLQKHVSTLIDLQVSHNNLSSLRSLISSIGRPRSGDDDCGEIVLAVGAPPPPAEATPNWGPLLATLRKLQGEDVMQALQDLDHLSARKPALLDTFGDAVAALLLSPSSGVRSLAHVLLTRQLRHSPQQSTCASLLPAYFRCLDSPQPEIVVSALDHLPEVVLCAQEHALSLLHKVFELGMSSNVNTVPHISKTIALLNVQTGC
ncbi:integrator complex subunit 1 isoform X1 [Schistocerca nitens]|uniref:integrator complex subunit 1 isoform X1 n=1 Tax=Schistocerca nitens TaxID=7011 RepID=UPI002118CC17|nr:integrator complex subunit 1 isoform X1 [Schistocerca nitens]XP_049803947.1 integrator complex subunit 1 isoform X1 [Schistocerca nitens]